MAINVQGLQGQWNQLKGDVKKRWGQLSDDDLKWAGGNIDQLIGRIQQRTGESRDAIEKYLDQLTSQGASSVSSAVETVGNYASEVSHRLRDHYGQITDQAQEGYQSAREMVVRNPMPYRGRLRHRRADRHPDGAQHQLLVIAAVLLSRRAAGPRSRGRPRRFPSVSPGSLRVTEESPSSTPRTAIPPFHARAHGLRGPEIMLRMAVLFAIIALIAAGLGFYGLSDVSANIAKFFALIFAVLFVVALLVGARIFGGATTT